MRNLILTLTLLSALFAPAFGQTQQDIAVLLSACQFFAGSPLDAQEQQRIIAGARTDFAKDATKAQAEIQELRQLGTQLSQLSNPTQMIAVRQAGLYYFYTEKVAGRSDPSGDIVLHRAHPLAADANNKVLLLASDLDGAAAYLNFLRQSQGAPWSAHEIQQFKTQVVQNFSALPDQTKGFLLGGQIFWSVISHNLQRLSLQRQAELQQRVAQQQPAPMSMDAYQVLSNMSRAQHLTTMNILENMGGSGDYWEVEQRPSW
ncbi:hypothetical protein IV102_23170 [bacterium]|nr:hypothetical protein [bacterium]